MLFFFVSRIYIRKNKYYELDLYISKNKCNKKYILLHFVLVYFLISFCFCSDNLFPENESNNTKFSTFSCQPKNIDFNNFCKEFRRIMPIDRYSYPEDSLFSVYQLASSPKDRCNFMEFSKSILSSLTIYDRSYSLLKLIEIYNNMYNTYDDSELKNFYVYILNELPCHCRFESLNLIFLLYVDHLMLEKDDRLIFISFIIEGLSRLEADLKISYLRKDLVRLFSNRSLLK